MTDNKPTQWLVITDLDGTLLNHHDYSIQAALPAITRLRELDIPVVFNTSKTFNESITLQKRLKIEAPFIVENGSCIYLPKSLYPEISNSKTNFTRDQYWEIPIGKSHSAINEILKRIDTPSSYYQLLSSCSAEEASALTGLSNEEAEQAISREFSEPLIWKQGTKALNEFKEQLKQFNLNTLQGGRFLHVLGNCDKGVATKKLKELLKIDKTNIKTIILGDSENDAAMLQVADISIIVNSPSNHQLQQVFTPTIHTKQQAPNGWADAINTVLLSLEDLKSEDLT